MNHLVLLIISNALFLTSLWSQGTNIKPGEKNIPAIKSDTKYDDNTVTGQVLQAEKARFAAMVVRNFDVLDNVINEDLVYIHSNGSVDSKESFIGGIKSGNRVYEDITIDESKVRVYGDVGIINAKCTYHRTTDDDKPNNLSLHYTSVYALIEGRWQHVSWQSFKL